LLLRAASQEDRHKFLYVLNFSLYLERTTRVAETRDTNKIVAGNPARGIKHFGVETTMGD
jgi:hypothetical protein